MPTLCSPSLFTRHPPQKKNKLSPPPAPHASAWRARRSSWLRGCEAQRIQRITRTQRQRIPSVLATSTVHLATSSNAKGATSSFLDFRASWPSNSNGHEHGLWVTPCTHSPVRTPLQLWQPSSCKHPGHPQGHAIRIWSEPTGPCRASLGLFCTSKRSDCIAQLYGPELPLFERRPLGVANVLTLEY